QPFVTMGGGALPLPMPTQPETLTATRVATKAMSTFFIGVPLSFTPRDAHFVPRCTIGRPLPSMVHRLRRWWGTSKGTVSLRTQLGAKSTTANRALLRGAQHLLGSPFGTSLPKHVCALCLQLAKADLAPRPQY